MRQYLFPLAFFGISLVIFFAPEISRLLKSAQVSVSPSISGTSDTQATVRSGGRARARVSNKDEQLTEAFSKSDDLNTLMSREFRSALRQTRREVKALAKRLESSDLKLYGYLRAYDAVLDRVANFRQLDQRQASMLMMSLREVDALVTQMMLTSAVDRESARTWAALSLAPWITSSSVLRDRLIVTTRYAPKVDLERVRVNLPSRRRLERAYQRGEKIAPRISVALVIDDRSTELVEVYTAGSLVKSRKVRLRTRNLVRVNYRAPLAIHCFMFYDRFGESAYYCLDMTRVLNYYTGEKSLINLQKASWLPNGQFASDLNSIFLVGSSSSLAQERGFITF